MWEAEPTLYWRVKRDGVWTYERARFAIVEGNLLMVEFPRFESDESGDESD